MKVILKLALLTVLLISYCGTMYGQDASKQRVSREQLAEKQAKMIAAEMDMNEETSKRFIDTYCQYQKDLWTLYPRTEGQRKGNASNMTDAEAEQAIKDRFARSQNILNLREQYYSKYSQFLTQQQIQRVYQLEKQMMNRLNNQKMNRNKNKRSK